MPEFLRSTTLRTVRGLLQIPDTDQLISDTDITDAMIMLALQEISKRKSRKVVTDYVGNSESNVPLPTYWSDEFSVIDAIYISAEGFDEDSAKIDPNEYKIVDVDTTSRAVNSAALGATSVTLTTVTNALYF